MWNRRYVIARYIKQCNYEFRKRSLEHNTMNSFSRVTHLDRSRDKDTSLARSSAFPYLDKLNRSLKISHTRFEGLQRVNYGVIDRNAKLWRDTAAATTGLYIWCSLVFWIKKIYFSAKRIRGKENNDIKSNIRFWCTREVLLFHFKS